MQPTMKLRQVERNAKRLLPQMFFQLGDRYEETMVLVLQQWWEEVTFAGQQHIPTGNGEWRDIEIVEEE